MAQLSAIKAMFHNDAKVLARLDRIEAMHASTENVITEIHNALKSLEKSLHGATASMVQSPTVRLMLDSHQDDSQASSEESEFCSISGRKKTYLKKKKKLGKTKQQNDQTCNNTRVANVSGNGIDDVGGEIDNGDEETEMNCTPSNSVYDASNSGCIGVVVNEAIRKPNFMGFGDPASDNGEQETVGQTDFDGQKTNCCIPISPNKIEVNAVQSAESIQRISKQEPMTKPEADDIYTMKSDFPCQH
jgi:hypothetical protein